NLLEFTSGPPPRWRFLVSAGDSRAVEIELRAEMPHGKNITVLTLHRPDKPPTKGKPLLPDKVFSLTVRVDIEDRSFHAETHLDEAYEHFFWENISHDEKGFCFAPERGRQLEVEVSHGTFHHETEWNREVPHPIEANRGQSPFGDACSPGWFEIPLAPNSEAVLTVESATETLAVEDPQPASWKDEGDIFSYRLQNALQQFIVKRGKGQTVIAGYPWFLDWGRDTFIAARGLLAAGWGDAVRGIVHTFARLERDGTLPNSLHGSDDSNRETSDAPLWFGLVCEELADEKGESVYTETVGDGRSLLDVLVSIGTSYRDGTPNRIRMDSVSALVWSPSHFTWMDTNHPAGTPREGYPIEIQALWIRFLRQLNRLQPDDDWGALAELATESLHKHYWLEGTPWLADVLSAGSTQSAAEAQVDTALRCNSLIAVALGVVGGTHARQTVGAARDYLVVPGALRTLAPLPADLPLFIRKNDGELLNDPQQPYFGRYEGDEDTQRKPAYHNGTAWGWPLPIFCEAMMRAWGNSTESVAAAKGYLLSVEPLLNEGCLGQLPEILDGDAPHAQRGCDAQAWSVSEAIRVWKILNEHD
ncbi:MAG: amylo-alpha-1,6-glucosidase, partial [Verrucomicrobiales bacterium]|nr:amylo-alpha-1,6-glucosidase [Verrucomicrobiales bacterium]